MADYELSEQERAKILAEEKVRKELNGCEPARSQVSATSVVNSPFFLWLLSSIVLVVAGTWYTTSRDCRLDIRKSSERRDHLNTEIAYRASMAARALTAKSDTRIADVTRLTSSNADGLFTEFAKRSLYDLTREVQLLNISFSVGAYKDDDSDLEVVLLLDAEPLTLRFEGEADHVEPLRKTLIELSRIPSTYFASKPREQCSAGDLVARMIGQPRYKNWEGVRGITVTEFNEAMDGFAPYGWAELQKDFDRRRFNPGGIFSAPVR
jgi:hypothetical protein